MVPTIVQLSTRFQTGSTNSPISRRSPVKSASGAAASATPNDSTTCDHTSTWVGATPSVSSSTAGPMVITRRTVGAIGMPIIAWLLAEYGWRTSFIITGAIGFVWLFFWLRYFRNDPQTCTWVSEEERRYIRDNTDPPRTAEKPVDLGLIRRLLKTRSVLVQSMVKIKNQIHGMMLGYGIETKAAQLQSKRKRQELINDLEDHNFSAYTAPSLKVMLKILDDLSAEIKGIEKLLEEMVASNEDVALLMTVPGIGINTATVIAAYTAELERFEGNYKKFASYVGIIPSVHNSNETTHYGRITKHGPQELRTAFVQAALGMIRLTNVSSEWRIIKEYQRRKGDKGSGRAIIALARKITRIVFVMLSKREGFKPELMRCEEAIQQTA